MTLTKSKKKRLELSKKRIINFKKEKGITKCQWCGHPIENSPHHFLCWVCWNIQKKTSKRGMKKAKEIRQIQANKSGRGHVKTVY